MTQRFLLLFCLLAFFPSWSQVGTGSPYSFGGLGEINYRGNHWTRAMGGVEFYTDSIHVDFNNPASLSSLKMTNFSLGLDYRNTTLKDNQSTHAVTTSSLNYMGVSIPTKYFGFNFGLLPYSSVGYRQEYRNVEEEATEIQRYEGNGGLNMAFVSVGFKIHKWWSVGAMLRYGFGNITHRSSQLIENVDRTTFLESNSSMSGVSYKFSTLLKVPLGQQRLHFYSAYTPKATINSQNAEVFTTLSTSTSSVGQQLIVDLAASGLDETVMILPQSLSFGFGIGRVKKWFVGGQYQTIATSDFRNDFITLDGLSYENGNKLSIGAYTPEATINSQNAEVFTTLSTSTSSVGQQLIVDLAASGLDETVMILPQSLSFGFGIGRVKKWFVGGQYQTIATSDFRNDFITLDGLSYENGNKLSIGGFFIPNYSSLTDYWKRIVYRVGFHNQTTGIRVQGSSLTDRGIAFGVGLPALRLGAFSNANLGVTLGSRSTPDPSLVKENYWHVKLGFSLNDLWFIKRKYN